MPTGEDLAWSPWAALPAPTLGGDSLRVIPSPRPRTMGKGSVQQELPPPIGQHNLLPRAFMAVGEGLADSYAAMGRLPTSWDDALQQFLTVMPAGGLFGIARRVQFTPEMRTIAQREYQAGKSLQEVADRVGVATSTLIRHFRDEGVSVRPRGGSNRLDLPLDQIRTMYEQSGSVPDVAARMGVGHTAVFRRLHEMGVDTSRLARDAGILDRVGVMRRDGHSYGDIARLLGLTRNQVAGMVRDLRASGRVVPSVMIGLLGSFAADEGSQTLWYGGP